MGGKTEAGVTGECERFEVCEGPAGYLWVIDTQTLDFMQWQQNSDQKHLVFFFQRESKTVDDAVRQTGRSDRQTERTFKDRRRADITGECVTCPVSPAAQQFRCDVLSHI